MDVPWFENFDLENIVTPVDVQAYERLLNEAGYNQTKISKLVGGFRNGFPLEYQGETKVHKTAPNLPFNVGDKFDLWGKNND